MFSDAPVVQTDLICAIRMSIYSAVAEDNPPVRPQSVVFDVLVLRQPAKPPISIRYSAAN